MRRDEVLRLTEAYGPEAVTEKIVEMVKNHHDRKEQIRTKEAITIDKDDCLDPEKVSIRGLFEAFIGPADPETFMGFHAGKKVEGISFRMPRKRSASEEVGSTMFPIATGALIAAKVIDGYMAVGYIGDRLCTNMPSKHKVEAMVGFTALDGPQEVPEGKDYQGSDIGEKFVTVGPSVKRGRLIEITEENIIFDQTGQVLMRAKNLGERVKLDKEKRILKGVSGNDSNVYKPQNTATMLYSAGNGNLKTGNALSDWTSIDTILQTIAAQTDDKGEQIVVMPKDLLVPRALLGTARRVTRSQMVRHRSQGDQINPVETYSESPFAGDFDPMHSPLLDGGFGGGTGKTDWYVGDFMKAFVYQEIFPLETLAAIAGNPDEFKRDIKFLYKVREMGNLNCIDHRYVYRNQA